MTAVNALESNDGRARGPRFGPRGEFFALAGVSDGSQRRVSVGTSSTTIADALEGRTGIQIQPTGNPIYLNLDGAAGPGGLSVPAGEIYTFPAGVTCEGEITAYAAATTWVVVIEFKKVPEVGTM